jgi:hypothetical protein
MSRSNSEFSLRNFRAYLESRRLSQATAAVYTSHVRGALLRSIDLKGAGEDVVRYVAELPSDRRSGFKTAWRHFVAFGKKYGGSIPDPVFPDQRGERGARSLHPFAAEIAQLAELISPVKIEQLEWCNLRHGADHSYATLPAGREIEIPKGLIKSLYLWTFPSGRVFNGRAALLPEKLGGVLPMGAIRIHRIAQLYRQVNRSEAETGAPSSDLIVKG